MLSVTFQQWVVDNVRARVRDTLLCWQRFVTGVHRGITQLMPQDDAIAPQPVPITIYVNPAVRKYVLARLSDPEKVFFDERSRKLWEQLDQRLRGRRLVRLERPERMDEERPRQALVLHVLPNEHGNVQVSYYLHRYITSLLMKAYVGELREWVSWYHGKLGMDRLKALDVFRRRYDISEDDHPLENAYRLLYVQRRRKKRRRKVAR